MEWKKVQLKKLEKFREENPHMTDYRLAGLVSRQIGKSPEAVRWQLRQMHRNDARIHPPKILLMDIETLPMEGKFFQTWKQDIQPYQIKKDWSIACWSAKWLFEPKPFGEVVSSEEAIDRKEGSVLKGIWEAMNEADIVITHNGDDFDIKKLNTKFLIAGFPPPMYYKSIDTLSVLKKNFSFTYNKLDEVNKTLGIGRKIETSWKWWDECSEGNKFYLKKMLDYNKQDVHVLEELYVKLRPWIQGHPNMALFSIDGLVGGCPNCGSINIDWKGTYTTSLGMYKAFRCEDCGAIGRSTKKHYKLVNGITTGG